jgi:superfamily II DNA or RNA helicase
MAEAERRHEMLEPRPYQLEALCAIQSAEKEGVRRPLVVHPTGTGKTVTFAHLISQRANRGRSLILVHREELADQTAEKIEMIAPDLEYGIVKADKNDVDADVVIASVWTVSQPYRLSQLRDFATVIVDEAHHAPAPTWMKILTHVGSFSDHGPLTVGFTATPERDKKKLGVWEKVVSYMSIREAIYGGYLCDVRGQVIRTSLNLDNVNKKTGGDYADGSLGTELESSGAIQEIAAAYKQYAGERKGVAFLPTVATAKNLAEAMAACGIKAETISGDTDPDERKAILARLRTGETQVVTNCMVLTEGFDCPSLECVLVSRPTKSHGLYVQMVGRGTRPSLGKKDLLILDVTGASERHELMTTVDLGLETDETRAGKKPTGEGYKCPVCGGPCTNSDHLCRICTRPLPEKLIMAKAICHDTCRAGRTGEVDLFATSRLRWLPVGDAWCLGSSNETVIMLPIPGSDDRWKLMVHDGRKTVVLHDELPIGWAQGIGEDRVKALGNLVKRDAYWLRRKPTDAQLGLLLSLGLPESKIPMIKTRGDAADLITRIKARGIVRRLARQLTT